MKLPFLCTGLLLAGSLLFSACATAQTEEPASPVAVHIRLRSAGGGDATLTQRFADALRTLLAEEAKAQGRRFLVESPTHSRTDRETGFLLEGELSRAEQGAFLCVLRLRQGNDQAPPVLVAQWAGTARGLRDLTGNLVRDPRVSPLGLAGEMTRRIAGAVIRHLPPPHSVPPLPDEAPLPLSEVLEALRTMAEEGTKTKCPTLEALPENASEADAVPLSTIPMGSRFRLRATSPDAGIVWLVPLPGTGTAVFDKDLHANEELTAVPGRPLLLPRTTTLTAPRTSGTLEFVVLVRRAAEAPPVPGADTAASATATDTADAAPAVQILDGNGDSPGPLPGQRALEEATDTLSRLIRLYRMDPPGRWLIGRLSLPLVTASPQ